MRVLVCGGAGYIGSHTVRELLDRDYEVIVVDSLITGHRGAVPDGVPFYQGDLRDKVFLGQVFDREQIDAVIDFAAFSIVGDSMKNPYGYFDNNIGGTLSLLGCMMEHQVNYFVFSSTAAVYGEPEHIPIQEGDKTVPTNAYGETKLMVEKMLRWFQEAYGLRYTALRYFNAAGAHSCGEIGEDHSPETHLIPIILEAAAGKRDSVSIFGEDYPTEDGTCVRDYIHVTDLADAHILALERLKNGGESGAYNLGNGKGFSVKEVISMAKQITGRDFTVRSGPRREGDPSVLIASSEKAMKALGWNPKYHTLEQIIHTAWNWHSRHPHGFEDKTK